MSLNAQAEKKQIGVQELAALQRRKEPVRLKMSVAELERFATANGYKIVNSADSSVEFGSKTVTIPKGDPYIIDPKTGEVVAVYYK